MGLDFACQFQISSFDLMTPLQKNQVLCKMYELLKQSEDGSLFGYDKLSFIVDNNLNQMVRYLQSLIVSTPECRDISLKVLMQFGRVRCNPADYLACVVSQVDGKSILTDLSDDMQHIQPSLSLQIQEDNIQKSVTKETQTKFTESLSLNRGVLYYYKAGENKLDISSQDMLVTDGDVLYHLKRGKGLFKLGVGNGSTKISGTIKKQNSTDIVKQMEPCGMFLLNNKLYIRDYCQSPTAFLVFNSQTLQPDEEETEKWKKHYELELQISLIPAPIPAVVDPAAIQEVVTKRSLLWHKDAKSGRSLEIAPLFTDGELVYSIAFQKQIASDKPQMLVLESYDPKKDFTFVSAQILFQNDECEPFVHDSNTVQFLKSAQFFINGKILGINVPNQLFYFFDISTGKKIGQEKSDQILVSYSYQKHRFYSICSLANQNQCLFEIAFDNYHPHQLKGQVSDADTFEKAEQNYLKVQMEIANISKNENEKTESLMEQLVYGVTNQQPVINKVTEIQIKAQHTLILRFLDLKREQAASKLQYSEFIKVFKHPNVTYLTGATFSTLITASTQFSAQKYDFLYILRLLQSNFTALIRCQGSLPAIMRDYTVEYEKFFVLYNSVLRNKVYEKAESPIDIEIQRVCIEIMKSSINILYKSNQEIVEKFLIELRDNPLGINCNIFFDYFCQAENCDKLQYISGSKEIFKETCKIQLNYTFNQLKQKQESAAAEQSACNFIKIYAQRILNSYCDLIQKVSDRPTKVQKLSTHLQDKYTEEDNHLTWISSEVKFIYICLSDSLNSCIQEIQNSKDEEETNRIKMLILQQSPFAQIQVCLYSTVFTAIDIEDIEMLSIIIQKTVMIIKTTVGLFKNFDQKLYQWLEKLIRPLSYLISVKAYQLIRPQKVEQESTMEQQIVQTNLLSGGIDECFESEFSEKSRKIASSFELFRQSEQISNLPQSSILSEIIDPSIRSIDVDKTIQLLQQKLKKKDMISAINGGEIGLKLSLCAFASILKLQDQVHTFQTIVECYDQEELIDQSDMDQIMLIYHYANKQMRTWNHEIKNKVSEKFLNEVDQKFRKEKQDKIDKAKEIIQIDSSEQKSFFTPEEKEQIQQEQDRLFEIEIQKQYQSVTDIAKFLIKLQPPLSKIQNNSVPQQDMLQSWRQMQKDKGTLKSVSVKRKEILQSCSKEVISMLTATCDVDRIIKKVEDIYIAAHRRSTGLHVLSQLMHLLMDQFSRSAFIDCVTWMTAALRNNKNQQTHYLDSLQGCGRRLEEILRADFFSILSLIVKQLGNESNNENDMQIFINALRWRFSARDHQALSQLQLFQTLHKSQNLHSHWGKQIQTDFETSRPCLKFKYKNDIKTRTEIKTIFTGFDPEKLSFKQCQDFYKQLCEKFGEVWNENLFEETWRTLEQVDNKVSFETLIKNLQFKVPKSKIAKQIISLFEQIYANTISRLIESDIGANLNITSSSIFTKAKSMINQSSSELLLSEIFSVVFEEFDRYIKILTIFKGVDWSIYCQYRSQVQLTMSFDEYTLLDEVSIEPVESVKEEFKDETEEQKKQRLNLSEAKRIEDKKKQELNTVTRLYSESFLVRLIQLIDIFTSISASQTNLLVMAQRIASPAQLSTLFNLLILASPRIKFLVVRILSKLIDMKLPLELFEEACIILLKDPESTASLLFKKIQPALQFKKSKFLAFLHIYILSIRQKVWIKIAVESEGQYEISCELLKLMQNIYESQESDQHPWRQEINELISTMITDTNRINRPEDIEVLLSFIRGADFQGIAPYTRVENGKEILSVIGFASHEWLRRTSGNFRIEDTMGREDLAVIAVEIGKDTLATVKMIPISNLKIMRSKSQQEFELTGEILKQLLSNLNLTQNNSDDDVQVLNNKCIVLKLLNKQLQDNSSKFIQNLKASGFYEQLLRFVCKESAVEIKGSIVPIQWLEQSCFNIRKQACENQKSLLKTQESQMKLIGNKIYAAVLNPSSEKDKQYTRTKLLIAFNHKNFPQRKDLKLVKGSDISLSEDQIVQSQVVLVEPGEFIDGNALQILNYSTGIITYECDLQSLVSQIRQNKSVEDLDQKSIFVISRKDYELLQAVCTGQGNIKKDDNQNHIDYQFYNSLVKFGGFSQQIAAMTLQQQGGVESKTKFLFDLLNKIKDGTAQLKELEAYQAQEIGTIRSDVVSECQIENQTQLANNLKELNQSRSQNQREEKPIEGRFYQDTKFDNNDLATQYESKIKRLVNIYCRHIFWSLVQKDKIENMFELLLQTDEDIKAFVTFIKVVGNECYITGSSIKDFKQFIKTVAEVSSTQERYKPLLKIIFSDLISQYRKAFENQDFIQQMQPISQLFQTESQASKLMNPNIILPMIKHAIEAKNLDFFEVDELISVLLAINTAFYGDFKLKDKFWHLIIKILDKVPKEKIQQVIQLPLLEALFNDFERQNEDDQQECQSVQMRLVNKSIQQDLAIKSVFELKQSIQQRYKTYSLKSEYTIVQLEVIYKFFKLTNGQFFFRNNLTSYIQMHEQLIREQPDGQLSKHLLFMNQLTIDQQILAVQQQGTSVVIENQQAEKVILRVKPSSVLKKFQSVQITSEFEGKQAIIATYSQKDVEHGLALSQVFAPKAIVEIKQLQQNFTVDLSAETLTIEPSYVRVQEQILKQFESKIETQSGIYLITNDKNPSRRNFQPIKDHLRFKQVNFGKECTIGLLKNGKVIGFGVSKHRHFVQVPDQAVQRDDNYIPLNVKAIEGQSQEEKDDQRNIIEIQTNKRTTVCVTKAGQVFASGDKFAKNIKLAANQPFGFYQLPVDMSLVLKEKEPVQKEEGLAELFVEEEKEKSEDEDEFKSSKSQEEEKTLSHSAPVTNLQEHLSSTEQDEIDKDDSEQEYVPVLEPVQVEIPVSVQVEQPLKASQVWISKTNKSKNIVILALFKLSSGFWQFRTIGNSPFGLLGQGKDVKESNQLRIVDFGIPLTNIDQVVVGFNHFIVRAEGKVFAWGCYNSDSEERMIWTPQELTFFQQYKVKSLQSANQYTVALVEQVGSPDYFICGKFTPLSAENTYKSLKEFATVQLNGFFIEGQTLWVSVKEQEPDLSQEVKLEIESAQDFGFKVNQKIYDHHAEAYKKFEDSFGQPAKKNDLVKLLFEYIYARVKDNTQFEEIQWQDIQVGELKIDDSYKLSDEQKKQWLLLVVNYSKNIWGHLTYIGGSIDKYEGMEIIQNYIKNRQNVPMCLKNKLLQQIKNEIPKDKENSQTSINIFRKKANENRWKGLQDTKFEWTIFSIISSALRKNKYTGMRQNNLSVHKSKAWFTVFKGEKSIDEGGPFRESVTDMCTELQSKALDLFIPCSNQTNKVGDNRDCWIINPKATSKVHLQKFQFIGCMFGLCVRSGLQMNLNMAPIVWKRLTGESINQKDIFLFDQVYIQNLETYKKFKDDGKSEEEFISTFNLVMQCTNSANEIIDLVEDGANVKVTYSNLDQYINSCIKVRLTESKEQYKSIIQGFNILFKSSYLKMLSWSDLQKKIQSDDEIDTERLKSITDYVGCNEDHPTIKKFWKVFASFDNEEKKKYLRFVSGRLSLPPKEQTDIERHSITISETLKQTQLPYGRTCYFQLTIPAYKSEEIMKQYLLVVFNFAAIDGDGETNQENYQALAAELEQQLVDQPADQNDSQSNDSEEEQVRVEHERARRRQRESESRLFNNDYGDEGSGQEEE